MNLPEPYCPSHEEAGCVYPDMYTAYQMQYYAKESTSKANARIEELENFIKEIADGIFCDLQSIEKIAQEIIDNPEN